MIRRSQRWRQIAKAFFDDYVRNNIMEKKEGIINLHIVNLRAITSLSGEINCQQDLLQKIVFASFQRINACTVIDRIKNEKENEIMSSIIKLTIKETTIPLRDFKREFGNFATELNRRNSGLNLNTQELMRFIKPLYLETVEEIFNS